MVHNTVFPSGLLDAYTEVPGTKEGMSDSEKFKEGYKKKGKGKVKNPPPKKVEEAAEEVEEVEDDGVGESWDDGVVESWDQIDVEEMPVPVKVKKEMRKEEEKRKKDLEKAAKAQDTPSETLDSSVDASTASSEAKPQSSAAPVIPEPTPAETSEVTDAVKKLSHQLPKIKNKIIGTVKWFNCELGYGFIKRDDTGDDVIVYTSRIEDGQLLEKGAKVKFEIGFKSGKDHRGQAFHVKQIEKDVTGRVKWFDAERGYGFIIRDDTNEAIFVHKSAIGMGGGPLNKGDEVAFNVVAARKGPQASYVTPSRDGEREFPLEEWLLVGEEESDADATGNQEATLGNIKINRKNKKTRIQEKTKPKDDFKIQKGDNIETDFVLF